MEIQAIRGSTAFDSTSMAQSAQKQQETSSTENAAKPAGGAHGKPPAGGGGGAAPTGGAAKSTSSSESTTSSNKVYDKKDTDKDGTVSYSEELQYVLKHPEETEEMDLSKASQSTYDQQGKKQTSSIGTTSLINIFA